MTRGRLWVRSARALSSYLCVERGIMDVGTGTIRIALLGRFSLRVGGSTCQLTGSAEKLLAYLALREGPERRCNVASVLWPERLDERASANLRTLLWRLSAMLDGRIVECSAERIGLSPSVLTDLNECRACADVIRAGAEVPAGALRLLTPDLLPGWYDDWCLMEQERHRQLRMHALEELCRRATRERSYDKAIQAGLLAVACEPLRASAHRVVIAAHVAEGNVAEARRQLDAYRSAMIDAGFQSVTGDDLAEIIGRTHMRPAVMESRAAP